MKMMMACWAIYSKPDSYAVFPEVRVFSSASGLVWLKGLVSRGVLDNLQRHGSHRGELTCAVLVVQLKFNKSSTKVQQSSTKFNKVQSQSSIKGSDNAKHHVRFDNGIRRCRLC
ncbi:hypothetical protein Q31b_54620 [Novipirellula aureliae]|uniref:Uncharacterized protein n=1 Tax=Novipirellula aureliae TaxID=2527966 RepID=A0A5C6DK97_9BACT|nr:hypothetical protein Q31b_54620 [Novipirellula aureliae]